MSETTRLFLLALDGLMVALGLALLYVWAIKPKSLHWLFRTVKLTAWQTFWLLMFSIAVLLMQLIPYLSPWIESQLHLSQIFCGEDHLYCFRDYRKSR